MHVIATRRKQIAVKIRVSILYCETFFLQVILCSRMHGTLQLTLIFLCRIKCATALKLCAADVQ